MDDNAKSLDLFIQSSSKIANIASVLTQLKIYHFTFLERFSNGQRIYFSNNAAWIRDYFEKQLYLSSDFDKDYSEYGEFENVIWPDNSDAEVYKFARDKYNSDHGITLVKKMPNSMRYFFFSTSRDLPIARQIYINHLDALKRFTCFFEQEASSEIDIAMKNVKLKPSSMHYKQNNMNNIDLTQFYKNTTIKPKKITVPKFGMVKISPQEWNCFNLLAQHMTVPEMAEKLSLSNRTVESHIDSLKNKFGCFRKTELFEISHRFKYLFN